MKNLFLAAGVASLALAVPAIAGNGKGNSGGGKDRGGQQAQGGGQGGGDRARGGGGKPDRGGEMRMARGGGKPDRGGEMRMAGGGNDRGPAREMRTERGNDRGPQRIDMKRERREPRDEVRVARIDRKDDKVRRDDNRVVRTADWNDGRWVDVPGRGLVNGCPPGLAMKDNGCLPPGQAKKMVGTLLPDALRASLLPQSLRTIWNDDDDFYYRYGDGYMYRVDRDTNLIASLLPMFGGGYTLGQTFPYQSNAYAMPAMYQSFYPDSADNYYRYNNGYVYGVDPLTGMVENIIPTYDGGYGVGQMLPSSYSYYNLPYPYRSYYADNDDHYYRYAPGAIYQVDRDTQLISAVASLLTGGLGVGQQLPMGYDAYNVPYAYRDRYFDSPDSMYRYSNGYIYQVDPTTRLITAVIDAIV